MDRPNAANTAADAPGGVYPKSQLTALPTDPPSNRARLPLLTGDWKEAPAVKARLAGGFCVRAPVQGPCAYANICEHCPNFCTDSGYPTDPGRATSRRRNPRRDAETRGWGREVERHRRLIARLDAHIEQAQTR